MLVVLSAWDTVSSTPMRQTLPGCCARAATGHAAALLRSVMKSRRLMTSPPDRICNAAICGVPRLLDHLIGNGQQSRRNRKAKRHHRLHVDHKFGPCWLHHRQLGGPIAAQDAGNIE